MVMDVKRTPLAIPGGSAEGGISAKSETRWDHQIEDAVAGESAGLEGEKVSRMGGFFSC